MIAKVKIEQDLINVYDSKGKIISSLNSIGKELVGVTEDFYVVYHENNIEVYDADSTMVSYMQKGEKIVKGTVNNTFTVQNDVFIESYNILSQRLYINNIPAAVKKLQDRELNSTLEILVIELTKITELTSIFVSLQQFEAALTLRPLKIMLEEAIKSLKDLK